MFTDTLNTCAANAARIVRTAQQSPLALLDQLGDSRGTYVGLAIILIFTLGNLANPAYHPLIMGATFGIA